VLKTLLKSLATRKSTDVVHNPYQNEGLLNNLRLYFEYHLRNSTTVLLVGEAPGFRGCRLTGIPFTSGVIIRNARHCMFREIQAEIKLNQLMSENTATIIWDFLGDNLPVPIFWNAFPFHPHKRGNPETNRRPTESEIDEGKAYLRTVRSIFKPKKICSLGKIGEKALKDTFQGGEVIYIRHPSYGGKKEFLKGIEQILMNK
jgi:uracil-DNA glycosylase